MDLVCRKKFHWSAWPIGAEDPGAFLEHQFFRWDPSALPQENRNRIIWLFNNPKNYNNNHHNNQNNNLWRFSPVFPSPS